MDKDKLTSINHIRSRGTISEQTIPQLFERYSNILEIQLRYSQSKFSIMAPLVDQLPISKYALMSKSLWALASMIGYAASELLAMTLGFLLFSLPKHLGWNPHFSHYMEIALVGLACLTALVSFILLAVVLSLVAYTAILACNVRLGWGHEIESTLGGPTHISLSPLSVKLIWRGVIFSTIGFMFGWDEVTCVDLHIADGELPAQSADLVITVKKRKIVHNLKISLAGLDSSEERLLFLDIVDRHVPGECKSPIFVDYLKNDHKLDNLLTVTNEDSKDDPSGPPVESKWEENNSAVKGIPVTVQCEATVIETVLEKVEHPD